jgi:hypothetical protein
VGPAQQRALLNLLKHLTNVLQVTMVCAGTEDALSALSADAQVASRFQHVALRRWALDDDFTRFLRTIEVLMPLRRPSDLAQEDMAARILSLSRGVTGEVMRVLNTAAIAAIRNGHERITLDILSRTDLFLPGLITAKTMAGRGRA